MVIALNNFAGQLKEEPIRITENPKQTFFKTLLNAYVTNTGAVRGFPSSVPVVTISNPRDAFVAETRLFYASGNKFYLYPDTELHTLNSLLPLSYTQVNNLIYVSNGVDFFKIDENNNIATILQGDIDEFKMYLPAGFPIEHHRGRLFSAVQNNLYFSDLWDYEVLDKRYNLIQMPDKIVMISSTNEGILVGTDSSIYLLSYTNDIRESSLVMLSPTPCKSINSIKYDSLKTIFLTSDGFVLYKEMGLVSDRFKFLTLNRQNTISNYKRLQLVKLPYAQTVIAYDLRRF